MTIGSGSGVWVLARGDADSQWGRKSQRQNRKENRREKQQYIKENKQVQSAIDGTAEWSAFVSSSATSKDDPASSTSKDDCADDFFSSLMTDLNQVLHLHRLVPFDFTINTKSCKKKLYRT
jgi:hypothetical protein